jgi:acylphosphatase
MPTVHILVKGKVQGVFYRASAREVAENLKLTGWVKNTEEGNVEMVATGTKDHIKQFVDWCRQGPPKAVVTDIVVSVKDDEVFTHFKVIR